MKKDGDIHQHGPILDVIKVILNRLMNCELTICTQLPKTGDALWHREAGRFPRAILFSDKGHLWSGSDERHVSLKDIDELRDLVEACFAQEAPDAGNAGICLFIWRPGVLRCIHLHAAEFENLKRLSIFADASLAKEDGAF